VVVHLPAGADAETRAVLIIDDNVGFLRVIRAVLEGTAPSFTVHTVETGEEALAFLCGEPPFADAPRPAFVVLDFHLPDVDGPELLARIRARPGLKDIPVLVLSQADWAEDEAAATAAGSQRFRTKPSQLEELHEIVVQFWRDFVVARAPGTGQA
jgi:CheY-like chemotaxis protein